jgi:hypothetical protein
LGFLSSHLFSLPRLFCSVFFYRAFKCFLTTEFKNAVKAFSKKVHLGSSQKMWLLFPPLFFSPSVVLLDFLLSRFWAFLNKGVQKQGKSFFQKSPSGLITKNEGFFLTVFSPPLGCFA